VLVSLVPSDTFNYISSYSSATAIAALETAPIHPWSSAGAEKPIVTVSPSSSLSDTATCSGAASPPSSSGGGSFEVQAATSAAAAVIARTCIRSLGRDLGNITPP